MLEFNIGQVSLINGANGTLVCRKEAKIGSLHLGMAFMTRDPLDPLGEEFYSLSIVNQQLTLEAKNWNVRNK